MAGSAEGWRDSMEVLALWCEAEGMAGNEGW